VVTGTFQSPQFAPDIERVARMKLENLVPTANDPTGLTKGILGQIFRQKPSEEGKSQPNQNQPNEQQPPANPLEEIFKLIPRK
jgi:hypothetical protein